jgi:aspartyl protease family protein
MAAEDAGREGKRGRAGGAASFARLRHDGASMTEFPRALKLATVWLLIGLAVFLGVSGFESRQRASRLVLDGQTVALRRAPDGHFHWPGSINGVRVDFLVDTGATSTALPLVLAERAGLPLQGAVRSSTPGGVVQGRRARADVVLEGGVRAEQLHVTVLPDLAAPLLGMDVLGRLPFTQSDGVLRITAAR